MISRLVFYSSLLAAVCAGEAPKIKKNPADVIAVADFPFGGLPVLGNVVFTAKKGKVVNVHIDVTKLPPEGGPFQYHIHEHPIPDNGDCEAAGLHLNPYKASEDCEAQKSDSFCQVGDLSGKHGWIDTTCFETKYDDPFLSLNSKSKSSILGKSIVFHFANLTKFACANILAADDVRIKSLEAEYARNGNQDLNEVKEFVANNYHFTEAEEVFEASPLRAKRELEEYIEEDESEDVPCDKEEHHHNQLNTTHWNYTNLSSIDCENGASGSILNILGAVGLGVIAGLLC